MKKFGIQLTYSAAYDLDSIPENQRIKIITLMQRISSDPFKPSNKIKKLKSHKPPLYRARSGDYRILYRVQEDIVTIMRVLDRKDLDRIIKRLKLFRANKFT